MNINEFKQRYELEEDDEKDLWQNCIFIFDSSALLAFYEFPLATTDKIFSEIIEKIKTRLWIPSHVFYEYSKNRKSTIGKPIQDHYLPLKNKRLNAISNGIKNLQTNIDTIKKDTLNDDNHPYLDHEKLNDFELKIQALRSDYEAFKQDFISTIDLKIAEIEALKETDTILEKILSFFRVGEPFSYNKKLDISIEGKHRYDFEIPPGYKDQKDKKGLQIFGDLIIWKQILAFAREEPNNIIFICNDLKEDWCHINNRKRITSPRHELIDEFFDIAKKRFWMYNSAQFVYCSNEYLNSEIPEEAITDIENVINDLFGQNTTPEEPNFIFKCSECNHINKIDPDEISLDFELVEEHERKGGTENKYECTGYIYCENCLAEIEGLFEIWEYPICVINESSVKLKDAEIIFAPKLSMPFPYDDCTSAEEMEHWFLNNYKDPANGVPFESKEGGYIYCAGGPYTPDEILPNIFQNASEREIEKAIESIQSNGGPDWVEKNQY